MSRDWDGQQSRWKIKSCCYIFKATMLKGGKPMIFKKTILWKLKTWSLTVTWFRIRMPVSDIGDWRRLVFNSLCIQYRTPQVVMAKLGEINAHSKKASWFYSMLFYSVLFYNVLGSMCMKTSEASVVFMHIDPKTL